MKLFYIVSTFIVIHLISCTHKKSSILYGHTYQFFVSEEGILKIDEPHEDIPNAGNKILIYNTTGKLIGVQPISNSFQGFSAKDWKNDTIFILLNEVQDNYIKLLNENKIDYLKPVTKYKLKYIIKDLGYIQHIEHEKYTFDTFNIDQNNNSIHVWNENSKIGTYNINDISLWNFELNISIINQDSIKSIYLIPQNEEIINELVISIFNKPAD